MDERFNALNLALKNEMTEHQFYLRNAERTKNALGKAMFEQIAKEELEHYERLKQISANWEKSQSWPETVPLKVQNTSVKDVLRAVSKLADRGEAGDADDRQAIQTALAFEAKGSEFYEKLSNQVADPKEKAFFRLLSTIEHEHYLSLKDTEEYLTDPAAWFRKMEGATLDGA